MRLVFVVLLCLAVPLVALAQAAAPVAPPAPLLSFDQVVVLCASVVVPLLLGVLQLVLKDRADRYAAFAGNAISVAYHATQEAIAKGLVPRDSPATKKVEFAMQQLEAAFDARGYVLKDAVARQAKLTWSAMSGQEKTQVAVLAKAAAASESPADPTPALAGS